jgi:hypothetical protein
MAFFRFNRDSRGYEHFYLVEPITNRRGKSRPRVLYWYRTPPNVKVGRAPFDEEVQRALEAQNPTVVFDWRKIVDAPIPSADAEKWRERRRAERAEKAARRAAVATRGAAETPEPAAEVESGAVGGPNVDELNAVDEMTTDDGSIDAALETAEAVLASDAVPAPGAAARPADAAAAPSTADPNAVRTLRRRRRRRGRRPHAPTVTVSAPAPEAATAPATDAAPAAEPEPAPPNPVEPPGE